jgi:hypothetical protein
MNDNIEEAEVPFIRKIAFASGQIGWSLAVFGFTELIYFFYLPPDNGKPLFKAFVYQGALMDFLKNIAEPSEEIQITSSQTDVGYKIN